MLMAPTTGPARRRRPRVLHRDPVRLRVRRRGQVRPLPRQVPRSHRQHRQVRRQTRQWLRLAHPEYTAAFHSSRRPPCRSASLCCARTRTSRSSSSRRRSMTSRRLAEFGVRAAGLAHASALTAEATDVRTRSTTALGATVRTDRHTQARTEEHVRGRTSNQRSLPRVREKKEAVRARCSAVCSLAVFVRSSLSTSPSFSLFSSAACQGYSQVTRSFAHSALALPLVLSLL